MSLESNDIAKIFFKLLEEKQLLSDARERMLRIPNAEKRYLNMVKLMPVVYQNVKDDTLASYMNVTRRHLERIKIKTSRK
jgi:CRP-like cAMP-binding protein